jgi:hypothetical protein
MPEDDLGRRSSVSDLANKSETGQSCDSSPLLLSDVGWRSVRGETAPAMITGASGGSDCE